MNERQEKRKIAHLWFDRLWRNHEERDEYYKKLAAEMKIPYEKCHFSLMNEKQLDEAIKIIKRMWWNKFDV